MIPNPCLCHLSAHDITIRVHGLDTDAEAFAEWLATSKALYAVAADNYAVTILSVSDPVPVPDSCGREKADCVADAAQEGSE
ncbi:MAG: hypothetical protein WA125_04695 [Desulfosporosinus sp.]